MRPHLLLFSIVFIFIVQQAEAKSLSILDSAISTSFKNVDLKEKLFREALTEMKAVDDDSLHQFARIEFGKFFFYTSNYDSAYHYFLMAESVHENGLEMMAALQNMQGAALQRMEQYEAAVSHYIRALSTYEELEDQIGISKVCNNLSVIYRTTRDFRRAEEYLRRSIVINENRGDSLSLGQNYNNLGNVFNAVRRLDSALHYFKLAYSLKSDRISETSSESSSLHNIGMVLAEMAKYNEAENYLLKALRIRRELNDHIGVTSTLITLLQVYVELERFDEALIVYEEVHPLVHKYGGFEMRTRVESAAGKMYAGLGDYSKAVELLAAALLSSDSVYEESTARNILELEKRFMLSEKESEIRQLQMERQQNAQWQRWTRSFLIVSILFILILVVLIVTNSKRLKENKKLNIQYLKEKERAENTVVFKEQSIRILSHEVRTPLNGIIGLVQLLEEGCDKPEQHEMIEMVGISANRLMRVISNVLDYSRYQADKLEVDFESVDLNAITRESVKSFEPQARLGQLTIEHESPEVEVFVKADPQLMHSILNNLIGNAVKFTPAGGKIVVSAYQTKDKCVLEVRDSGIGMDEDQLKSLFQPYHQVSEDKKRRAVGTGLGLSIVKEFIELMNGDVSVESEKGKGSIFRVSLPVQAS
jgi:signal transduction histidine kinase/Tfp pilus assembly protein PilF